ncbi:hypothetical protein Y696_11320 [Mesotoga sp. H07pep.5.4]|nr:hypothetical protein Y696_11320 [Mesotoga sp. H07pep.5.4]
MTKGWILGRLKEQHRIGLLYDSSSRHPDNASGQDLDAARGQPLNGSPFSEKNGFRFHDASCKSQEQNNRTAAFKN